MRENRILSADHFQRLKSVKRCRFLSWIDRALLIIDIRNEASIRYQFCLIQFCSMSHGFSNLYVDDRNSAHTLTTGDPFIPRCHTVRHMRHPAAADRIRIRHPDRLFHPMFCEISLSRDYDTQTTTVTTKAVPSAMLFSKMWGLYNAFEHAWEMLVIHPGNVIWYLTALKTDISNPFQREIEPTISTSHAFPRRTHHVLNRSTAENSWWLLILWHSRQISNVYARRYGT